MLTILKDLAKLSHMQIVNIHEAKTHLSRLIEEVSQGKEIIIGKAGKSVAKLSGYTKPVVAENQGV